MRQKREQSLKLSSGAHDCRIPIGCLLPDCAPSARRANNGKRARIARPGACNANAELPPFTDSLPNTGSYLANVPSVNRRALPNERDVAGAIHWRIVCWRAPSPKRVHWRTVPRRRPSIRAPCPEGREESVGRNLRGATHDFRRSGEAASSSALLWACAPCESKMIPFRAVVRRLFSRCSK